VTVSFWNAIIKIMYTKINCFFLVINMDGKRKRMGKRKPCNFYKSTFPIPTSHHIIRAAQYVDLYNSREGYDDDGTRNTKHILCSVACPFIFFTSQELFIHHVLLKHIVPLGTGMILVFGLSLNSLVVNNHVIRT